MEYHKTVHILTLRQFDRTMNYAITRIGTCLQLRSHSMQLIIYVAGMSELNFIDLNNAATSSLRSERGEHLASGRGRYKKMNAKPSDQDRVKCFLIQIMRFSKDCNYS